MGEMGMTDKQFSGFLRFIIDDLKEIQKVSDDSEKVQLELEKIIDKLQKIVED